MLLGGMMGGKKGSEGPKSGPEKMVRTQTVDGGASAEVVNDPAPVGPDQVRDQSAAQASAESFAQDQAKPPPVTESLTSDVTETIGQVPEPTKSPIADLAGDPAALPDVPDKVANVTDNLFDEAPPALKPSEDVASAGMDAVPQVAAMGDEGLPVSSSVAGEQFGDVPQTQPADMVADQLGKKPPKKLPRIRMKFQSGNPSKQPDMPQQEYAQDQGYAFQGASTPDDMFSPPKYT
jgi:hypothetical protein